MEQSLRTRSYLGNGGVCSVKMSGIAPNSPRYMIFPHCFQIGTFTLNLGRRFLLMGRIVTPYPDTPAVGPDTPDMEFLSHLSFSIWAPQPLKLTHLSHSSLSLSLSLVTLSPSNSLKSPLSPQTLELKNPHPKSIPRPRKLQSAWGIIFSRYSTMGWLRF